MRGSICVHLKMMMFSVSMSNILITRITGRNILIINVMMMMRCIMMQIIVIMMTVVQALRMMIILTMPEFPENAKIH